MCSTPSVSETRSTSRDAQPIEIEVAVEIAREAHERAAIVVAIAVVQPIEAGLDRVPQPRRDERDDERREQRPELLRL